MYTLYNRIELKSVREYSEEIQEYEKKVVHHYLELIYEVETSHGIYEIIYPKVDLCLSKDCLPTMQGGYPSFSSDETGHPVLKWASIEMPLRGGSGEVEGIDGSKVRYKDAYKLIRTVKEKPVDMTLEEIEKKLGYKVKIVSEKK